MSAELNARNTLEDTLPLWEKQESSIEIAFERLAKGRGMILGFDPGTGKTRCGEELIQRLSEEVNDLGERESFKLVLVVSTISSIYEWPKNWAWWGRRPVAFIDLHRYREAGLRKAVRLSKEGGMVICLINYTSLPLIGREWSTVTVQGQKTKKLVDTGVVMEDVPWDMVIFDEIHKLKTPGSRVSKYVYGKLVWKGIMTDKPVARIKYRLGLTGTLFTKRPLDAWRPIKVITGEEVFQGGVGDFKARFTMPDPKIYGRILGYTNLKLFAEKLKKCCIVLEKEDVVELPPEHDEVMLVRLTPRAEKLYQKIAAEGYAEIVSRLDELDAQIVAAVEAGRLDEAQILSSDFQKEITAAHIFAQRVKLRQLCGGFITPDKEDGGVKPAPIRVGTEKAEALLDILEEREGKPTVVVVQWDEEEKIVCDAVEKALKFRPKVVNGSVVGAEKRQQIIADAASDPVLVVKESVVAEGIDMRWTDLMVWWSPSNNTDIYDQMTSRNHRAGVKHEKISRIHLLVEIEEATSIDQEIYRSRSRELKQADRLKARFK